MFKEFKEFAMKGNVMDLAIGVVIGTAFQKIVTSLVNDIIMPLIASLTGKVNFSDLTVTVGGSTIMYGNFITTIINFIIIAFSIFLAIKYVNKLNSKLEKIPTFEFDNNQKKLVKKKKGEVKEPEPTTKICNYCYGEVDIKATRCKHCTSNLEKTTN